LKERLGSLEPGGERQGILFDQGLGLIHRFVGKAADHRVLCARRQVVRAATRLEA